MATVAAARATIGIAPSHAQRVFANQPSATIAVISRILLKVSSRENASPREPERISAISSRAANATTTLAIATRRTIVRHLSKSTEAKIRQAATARTGAVGAKTAGVR